jgi:hypothetical protein
MSTLQRLAYEPISTTRLAGYVLGILVGVLVAAVLLYLSTGNLPLVG